MDINLNDGENSFSFSEFEDYDSLLEAILSTGEKEEDIIRDYTISLIGFDNYDIDFYRAKDLQELYKWYTNILEFDSLEQEVIVAYNDLYGFTMEIDGPLDEFFGKYDSDYEAAYELLINALEFTPEQASFILDDLDCTKKIIDYGLNVINGMYFYK